MGGEGYITKDFFILEFYKSCWQYEIRFIFITLHLTSKITTCISSNSYCHWNQKEVVIHAPTRGATFTYLICNFFLKISILTPTRGATLLGHADPGTTSFQSTLPQGERQQYLTKKSFYPVKYYKNIQIRSKNLSLFHLFKTNSNFFVHYFWCESSGRFMCTIHSHQPLS